MTSRSRPARKRRALWFGSFAAILVVAVGAYAAIRTVSGRPANRASASSNPAGPAPAATAVAPAGLARLPAGRYAAVVNGTLFVVVNGTTQRLLREVHREAFVLASSHDSFLVGTLPWEAMIVDPSAVRFGEVLPSGVELVPDALGRWWSNFGQLGGSRALHLVTFPDGARPVSKLADGYLVVDAARTELAYRPATGPETRVGPGNARVLAVARDLVAWSAGDDPTAHITNLGSHRTVDVSLAGSPLTARFSPDLTRLAILDRGDTDRTVLADTTSGRVIKRVATSGSATGLYQFRNVPPALEPSPFNWDPATDSLIVVSTSDAHAPAVVFLDANGRVERTVAAPAGLTQLVALQ